MNKSKNLILGLMVIFLVHGPKALPAAAKGLPQRVISLAPIITETIFLLGAQDQLIANTTYCITPEGARFKEKIGSVTQVNLEKIIRLQPDLVMASGLSREKQLKILENQSIDVFRAKNPRTFEQICQMTLALGLCLGKQDRAERIVDKAQKEAFQILSMTRDLKKPKVFIQIGLKPLYSANKDMFINEWIWFTGGANIAENEPSGIYGREKVLAQNPDIILIATMGTSKKAGQMEKQRWMTFKSLTAARSGRIHVLDPETICSPTPVSFVQGIKDLLPLIHTQMNLNQGAFQ